jgi:predicted HTH domain antitoxin
MTAFSRRFRKSPADMGDEAIRTYLHDLQTVSKVSWSNSTIAREVRMLAAVKLYELGRLSSGRAAELAGVARVEFLLALGRYKVFPFEAELNDLEQTYARGHQ